MSLRSIRGIIHKGALMADPKVSIIIPTAFDKCESLVKPNLESLIQWTDLSRTEVIVVCNGCTDNTAQYVNSLGGPFRAIEFPDAMGFTKATNEGLKVARGEYIILMNNDVVILPYQPKNQWLKWLIEPFLENPKMGITGPLQLHDDYADQDVIIGFMLCIKKSVLDEVMPGGLLDEIYAPGGGEDIDLCCRVRDAGYIVRQVPKEGKLGFSHTNTGDFPVCHINNQTFKDIPEYTRYYVKRNGWVNVKRHAKKIHLNIGSGGVMLEGYLSMDMLDQRANIIMDATAIDIDDNRVDEIVALHLIEHLSPYKVDDTLKEWFRVLKPGGRLVLELPDIEDLCKRFTTTTDFNERWGVLNAMYAPVNTTAVGAPTGSKDTEITSPHLYGYWPADLENRLRNTGFDKVTFGPEVVRHPYGPNMHVDAWKPNKVPEKVSPEVQIQKQKITKKMMELWDPPMDKQVAFGSNESYQKAMDFLGGCDKVEDWGCGTAWAKKFLKEGVYVGVDGTKHPEVSVYTELAEYRSQTEGLLLRHVLEHNPDWKTILENAISSFTKKMVVVISTPFNSAATYPIRENWDQIPDLSFKKEELTKLLGGLNCKEEKVKSDTTYGEETIFYVWRDGA